MLGLTRSLGRKLKIRNDLITQIRRNFQKIDDRIEMDILEKKNKNQNSLTSQKKESLKKMDALEYKREIIGKDRSRESKRNYKKKRRQHNYEQFKPNRERFWSLKRQGELAEGENEILQISEGDRRVGNGNGKENIAEIEGSSMKVGSQMANLKLEFKEDSNTLVSKARREKKIPNQKGLINPNNLMAEISGIPQNWTDPYVQKYFDPTLQQISRIRRIRDASGRVTDRCILTFQKASQKESFIDNFHNDFINSNIAIERVAVKDFIPKRRENRLKVYRSDQQMEIFNLPYELTYIELHELLSRYGEIIELQMPMRSQEKNKGYALVLYKEAESVRRCLTGLENFVLYGRKIGGREKYVSFDTQLKRIGSKSDYVIKKAEFEEVGIRGKFFKSYVENRDILHHMSFEF